MDGLGPEEKDDGDVLRDIEAKTFKLINPNQLSPGQKCPGDNFFFNALFVSEHFKHFEIYLFLTHFGG